MSHGHSRENIGDIKAESKGQQKLAVREVIDISALVPVQKRQHEVSIWRRLGRTIKALGRSEKHVGRRGQMGGGRDNRYCSRNSRYR